jgi:glycosyltransferase involved in cell wall biosynthesis
VDNAAYNICNFSIKEKSEVCNIVSVAGLNEMKNVFMYAEIGKLLKARGFIFNMKIVGDGPLYNELSERIRNYGIADIVKLEGKQIDPKPYYEAAHIYIHPADKEGFGMTVAEAMSAGIPVIVSNKGGVPELINNMEDGLVVDAYKAEEWADAIINLYNDRALYHKLAQNGYITYKNRFTPKTYANNLDKIYDSLISE